MVTRKKNLMWHSHDFVLLVFKTEENFITRAVHSYLNFIVYALELNETSTFIFIV